MTLKKDKQKILGEFFDDTRIQLFLNENMDNSPEADFNLLEKAYRGMISENFATFVTFFITSGKDINTPNTHGETFLQTIKHHKQADEYIQVLKKAGAQ